jgi:hypothetical protein
MQKSGKKLRNNRDGEDKGDERGMVGDDCKKTDFFVPVMNNIF